MMSTLTGTSIEEPVGVGDAHEEREPIGRRADRHVDHGEVPGRADARPRGRPYQRVVVRRDAAHHRHLLGDRAGATGHHHHLDRVGAHVADVGQLARRCGGRSGRASCSEDVREPRQVRDESEDPAALVQRALGVDLLLGVDGPVDRGFPDVAQQVRHRALPRQHAGRDVALAVRVRGQWSRRAAPRFSNASLAKPNSRCL